MTGEQMTLVGMISGTSMDGIDVAGANFQLEDDCVSIEPLGSKSVPYSEDLLRDLRAALPPATTSAADITRLDNEIGRAFADAARQGIRELAPGTQFVVSHGQTIFHWVEEGSVRGTLQIGEPTWIAEATGLPVVARLRVADVAAGGQGAPLASLFDSLLLSGTQRRSVSLNLGGIANLTFVAPGSDPIAYDTGPANALIDAAMAHITSGRKAIDEDGAVGASGQIDRDLLDVLLAEPYYSESYPKTTGKELFHLPYLLAALEKVDPVSDADLVATVTALSAITVADACKAHDAEEVVVAGGGVANPTLMAMLREQMPDVEVRILDELGLSAASKEAYFIALIGFLTVHELPGNIPTATGATRPVIMGDLLPGRDGFHLPPRHHIAPTRLRIVTER